MKIGILGATGAVGRQMLECLAEQNIEAEEIRLFASERSKGHIIRYKDQDLVVETVSQERLNDLDYALGAVSASLSREYAPMLKKAGVVYIDNSSAFRLMDDVPLVVPEINGEDAKHHNGIIANPNCSTIITLMAVAPIHRITPIKRMFASTYQAVSGAGNGGITELQNQMDALNEGKEITTKVFPKQIAFNCIPMIGTMNEDGYTTEEAKMQNEGRKILHAPDLTVSCTCVRVPVFRSHSISVSLECESPVTVAQAEDAIRHFEGSVYCEEDFPTPLETSNQDLVYVGRIRQDQVFTDGLALWCCGDQIRKGAASNAVGILKYLIG